LMMMSRVGRVQRRPVRLLEESEAVSFSYLSNSRETADSDRCRVSGATGANDYTPTPHEWNRKSHSKLQDDRIQYQTQVEIPVATVDFYFSLESRPLLVFVDDPGPSWNRTDGKGRRTTPAATEKRIQNLRTILRQLLPQEKRPTIPRHT